MCRELIFQHPGLGTGLLSHVLLTHVLVSSFLLLGFPLKWLGVELSQVSSTSKWHRVELSQAFSSQVAWKWSRTSAFPKNIHAFTTIPRLQLQRPEYDSGLQPQKHCAPAFHAASENTTANGVFAKVGNTLNL